MSDRKGSTWAAGTVRRVRRVETTRYPFVPFGLLPLLGLALVMIFAVGNAARGWIQADAGAADAAALEEIGADWATASVSGQWVRLEGAPPSRTAGDAAIRAVKAAQTSTWLGRARPATRVTGQFEWPAADAGAAVSNRQADSGAEGAGAPAPGTAAPQTYNWVFRLEEGVLVLEGEAPDEATRRAILEAARELRDPPRLASIDDRLQIAEGVPADGFSTVALRGVRALARCQSGRATFQNAEFSLDCLASRAAAADLRALASAELAYGAVGEIEVRVQETAVSCNQQMAELLSNAKIEFAVGSAIIEPASGALLDRIAETAGRCPGQLRVEGHTDNTGSALLNERLSQQRAEAVVAALSARGVRAARLSAVGLGAREPVADNGAEAGRARNRRIEIEAVRDPR